MTERIQKLTELVLQGKMLPEAQAVEYDRTDLFLSEKQRDAKRIYEYVTAQKPVLTPYSAMTGLLVFDRTIPGDAMSCAGLKNIKAIHTDFYAKPLDNLSTFEWQHATADYNHIIRKGIRKLIEEIELSKEVHKDNIDEVEFLDALKSSAEAMIVWAHKCSDESRRMSETVDNPEYKNNLCMLADALQKVPENKAETFYEAVLSIYILFSYDPDSVGTLDRTLYDFYINDINSGTLTRERAKEYLQELFLMLQAKTPLESKNFTKGGESHFSIGGYLPNKEDGFTDLSMLILEALTDLPTYIPQVSLRWTKKLPYEIFKKVMDFERNDPHKRIAFVNDESKIYGFMHVLGFSFEDACRYTTLGCNECAFPGGFVAGTTNANIMRCMENTFFKRTDDILKAETFDEFFSIYKEELTSDLDEMFRHSDNFNRIRAKDSSYVSALLFNGCIEQAKPHSQGVTKLASAGVGVVGITNTIDSLAIVKQFVYDEKIIDMKTMVDALHNDWNGYEELHYNIKAKGNFFGNDDDTSNYVASLLFDTIYDHLKDKRNYHGFRCGIGNLQGYNPHHKWFGEKTKASPDGRRNGEMLKFGIGQSGGNDRNGLTALLSSVAKCDKHRIMYGSSVTNLFVDEQMVRNDESFDKLTKVLETYFNMGGTHFQLSYVSKEDLKNAKINPEDYKSLRVRVSGFSDYFVKLTESIQDDIIERTVLK